MATTEPYGYWRIMAGDTDITFFRGARTHATFALAEPFGCGPATLDVPALRPLDVMDAGAQEWTDPGTFVEIFQLDPDGENPVSRWSGEFTGRDLSRDDNSGRTVLRCIGDMEAAGLQMHQPPASRDPIDIGYLIADLLNAVVGRRYRKIERVATGILTTKRGADDQSVLAFCQELLGDACTSGGDQWTVARSGRREYTIRLKDRDSHDLTMQAAQAGLTFRLSIDASRVPTRIFGSGVTKQGFGWSNMFYPGATGDDAPSYPFSDPSQVITLGTAGSGVSRWQRRVNELNITPDVVVDGVYNSNDATACRQIQREYGLQVDGIVGPQTWAATFDVGGGISLGGMIRRPLALIDAVEPLRYNADGSVAGENPTYDPSLLLVDLDVDFGAGVTKEQGRRAAEAMLQVQFPPGLAGDVTLKVDPPQMHRSAIAAGMNIQLRGIKTFDGHDSPWLHIAGVKVDTRGPVDLNVDERGRDLLSLVELRRNRELAVNPVRLPKSRKARRSSLNRDAVVAFDGESRGGIIPEFALFSGLWSVIRIPVSQAGTIAKTRAVTTGPATPFAMALFGDEITPADLLDMVGNPLGSDNPWEPNKNDLDGFGWVEGWGSSESKCGVNRSGTTTGVFEDEGTLNFQSIRPPLLWVAFYAANACRVSGRLYPAPLDA